MVRLVTLAAATAVVLCTGGAAAGESASRSTTLSAGNARIDGVSGTVEVIVEDRRDVQFTWSGSKRWVDAVQPKVEGDTAVLAAPMLAGGGGSSTVVANNVTVTATEGSSASVTIGGREVSSSGDTTPRRVELRLPRNGDLGILGLTGGCRVGSLGGKLVMRLQAGQCSIASLGKGAELGVSGSGDLSVAEAKGDVDVAIDGNGIIRVDRAQLGALRVRISGTGDVTVDGRSRTADLSIAGAATIRVRQVDEQPRRSLAGAGLIAVGNWP